MKYFAIVSALSVSLLLFGCSDVSISIRTNGDADRTDVETADDKDSVASTDESDSEYSLINEYCFSLAEQGVYAVTETSTPYMYVMRNAEVKAAINGVYWGADDGLPQGLVQVKGVNIASGKGLVSGYLWIEDNTVYAGEELKNEDAPFVIGTHPLLIVDGEVHEQAGDDRYNTIGDGSPKTAFRSSIGTKSGNDLCFVSSSDSVGMKDWATRLKEKGYTQAINLDGGPPSQLAVRDGEQVVPNGMGLSETRLIFYTK
jgi:exopolysaccharide biosynthesis protein